MTVVEIIISLTLLFAAAMTLVTAAAMWRAPDAMTRANLLGPTIGVALPLIIAAHLLYDWSTTGFVATDLLRACIAITGLLAIGSLSTFYLGRSIFALEKPEVITAEALRTGCHGRQGPEPSGVDDESQSTST
ncbi:Na+/H+ antiporter subunit G [Corynebacterium sp. CCM 9185]|uniref:Na+/H+ antiporter subunit G n=1 Tax=Corynebacterium marambiense TaxID=2765364 RepID=A0ABS0VS85_9CORY|nr:Na+/H+ antiporter subunit G [Corynebacterium marambiense]MBI8999641.1 Na+/H+ antiporter subunit G [Corynebacterium marambiense]MCK7662479.1 Na+/H+ antiporter subunit G [Corynebacterium marambiense]MCX7541767.1 Na+/H+ antiporter subunit G [Corynebacterium marambiense]